MVLTAARRGLSNARHRQTVRPTVPASGAGTGDRRGGPGSRRTAGPVIRIDVEETLDHESDLTRWSGLAGSIGHPCRPARRRPRAAHPAPPPAGRPRPPPDPSRPPARPPRRRRGHGQAHRRRQGRGRPHDHRPAARLVQLRRDASTSFTAKYGIPINELNPDGGSGDEIEAIKANKDNPGPQAPDVIDVGLSFGPSAKAEGLLQPYKVATWDTIPDAPRMPTATGTATTTASCRSRSTPPSSRTSRRTGPTCSSPSTRARSPSPATRAVSNQAISGRLGRGARQRRLARRRPAGPRLLQAAQRRRQLRPGHRQDRRPSPRARRRSASRWTYNALADRDTLGRQPDRSRSSSRRPVASVASTSRRSAPTRRIPTPPSCGWSTSTPTRARSSG